jgi:putative membrane protein
MTDKSIFRLILAVSIVVTLVIAVLQLNLLTLFPSGAPVPAWVSFLPKLNAILNGSCSVLLILSISQIKKGNINAHKFLNITAFILSSMFLVSYIIFHATGIRTSYGGEGIIKYIYYFILITHIILAAIVLPLVLFSFYSGLQMNVAKHRRLVRWSFPIWFYVTVTGVIVYLMIAPYYTF